jgi:hypothetical protein
MTRSIEDAIFELLSDKPTGASIAPEQAARAADPDLWRQRLAQVGKLADPETLKGVYRLRLPIAAAEPPEAQPEDA